MTKDIAAILLAAGRSRRIGAFKPLLPFGQTTVIRSCLQNLQATGIENIVVVVGHRAGDVMQSLYDLHLRFALNPNPESEMSASIACGMRGLPSKTKATLIALTDQPAVSPEVIKAVLEQWTSGAKLVIPEFQGRGGHPVLVDLSFGAELLNLDPNLGLKSFFDAHREAVRRVPVNSPYIARDMDTWDDYCALHQEIFGTLPDMSH
ncbi:MAG TPA: nucleotidyltransferase family protein [Pyrinomonadaceae bacterium]|nr:nucleotidyltransferase family protein [Pyrinomonadaceae bacterium]